MVNKLSATLTLSLVMAGAAQSQTRELDAHQHGHGALNIAFEGATVAMELEAPGADIVGFEHPAKTAEDRALIERAIAQLAKPLELFVVPAAAACTVTAANVALIGEDEHEEGHEHGHGHEEGHSEDHSDDHSDEHADHADEGAAEEHTEFVAEYMLSCADPSALDSIEFAYFGLFPNALELDVQTISDKGANKFEVERDEPLLRLSGAM